MLLASLMVSLAQAAPPPALQGPAQGLGIGVVAGDPSGLSLAYRPGQESYFQFAAGWSFTAERFHLNADYIYTITELTIPEDPSLVFPLYVGIGGRFRLRGDDQIDDNNDGRDSSVGLRIPFGIAFAPRNFSMDVFLEPAFSLILFPDTDLGFDISLGVRFYFF
ncbi:MAG: hypothetical protein AAFV53_23340 [Myxococcota bacterium]